MIFFTKVNKKTKEDLIVTNATDQHKEAAHFAHGYKKKTDTERDTGDYSIHLAYLAY